MSVAVDQAETFKRVHPAEYFRRFVDNDVRPDGRRPLQFRKATVNTGSITTANGSAAVRLGKTSVVCGIKAELTNPPMGVGDPKVGHKGWLVPNVTLGPICGPEYGSGPPSSEAQALSQFLDDVLKTSGTLDLGSLCIVPDKLCWVLYLDVYCLNDDGNLTDASLLAAITALKDVKLPPISEATETTMPKITGPLSEGTPLDIKHTPLAVSFGMFDGKHLLADPSSEEEQLLGTTVTVVVDEEGCIYAVKKPSPSLAVVTTADDLGATCSVKRMDQCMTCASSRSEELCKLLQAALKA